MAGIRRFVQIVYCIYALTCFIIIMFLVLPFVILFSLFGIKGGNLVYKTCNIWGTIWYGCIGIWHKEIYESLHDKNRQYIFVANHSSYMDIPAVIRCMHQPIRVFFFYNTATTPEFYSLYRAAVILVARP